MIRNSKFLIFHSKKVKLSFTNLHDLFSKFFGNKS